MTDLDPRVVSLLKRNAWEWSNCGAGLTGEIDVVRLGWGSRTEMNVALEMAPGGFDVVLISDCNYDTKTMQKLWRCVRSYSMCGLL